MDAGTPRGPQSDWDFWSQGLDREFCGRVYRHGGIIGGVIALMLLAFEQRAWALGLVCGVGVGIFSMWTVEATVRLLFRGGANSGLKLAFAALLKLPFMGVGLGVIALAAINGILSMFAVVLGVLLVHGTALVTTISAGMAQVNEIERYFDSRPRRRW